MRNRATRGAAALALLVTLVGGCADVEPESGRRLDGPLVARVVAGGQGIWAPPGERDGYWVSLGGLGICTDGAEVRVEGIRPVGDVPVELRAYVHRGDAGERYMGVLGAAPRWRQPYADVSAEDDQGTYDPIPGAVVDEQCPAKLGPALVAVMRTGPEGLATDGFWLDYRADGVDYTVSMPWELVLCGSEQRTEMCDGSPG